MEAPLLLPKRRAQPCVFRVGQKRKVRPEKVECPLSLHTRIGLTVQPGSAGVGLGALVGQSFLFGFPIGLEKTNIVDLRRPKFLICANKVAPDDSEE